MSSDRQQCDRLERWLLDQDSKQMPPELSDHLESCAGCSEQVRIHEQLDAFFAAEEVPELSTGFDAGLERKLRVARVDVRPLAGWRRVAMIAYAMGATGTLLWALKGAPLPAIDLTAPWVPVAAFLTVPLSLALAAAASRWLPAPELTIKQRAWAL